MHDSITTEASYICLFLYKKCNIVKRKQWVMEVLMPIWTKNSPEPFLISSDGASFEVVVVFNNLIILWCTLHHLLVQGNCKGYCMGYTTTFIPHDNAFPSFVLKSSKNWTLPFKLNIASFTTNAFTSVIIHVAYFLSFEVIIMFWNSIVNYLSLSFKFYYGLSFPCLHLI